MTQTFPQQSATTARTTCIVGLGGCFGDDGAGWRVIQRLKELLGPQGNAGVRLLTVRTPAELLGIAEGASTLVVIDACQGLASPGDVAHFRWPTLPLEPLRHGCGHNVSLVQALGIAAVMGQLPQHCEVWCIEGRQFDFSTPLSAEARHAAERVAVAILNKVGEV
jgi:hydrogenase maturation protease